MMRIIITFLLLVAIIPFCFSQGCSDAGFCTMGAMKPDQPFNKKIPIQLRSMEVSFYRGTTTLSPIVYVATIDASFGILDQKTTFQVKLPYQSVKGNFGSTASISDISLCLTRNIFSSDKFDINVSVGGKIPTNDSDIKTNFKDADRSLPMYYQTSLGTYDLIAGVSVINRKWLLATGIQYPLNKNKNSFTWGQWDPPVYEGGRDYVLGYDPCFELKRGTDVMLRLERNFRLSRINGSLGVLPIFRITKDEILNVNTLERVKLDGTLGMALSAIATVGYSFNVKSGVRLLYGKKITQRDVNPDGLTRRIVTTISYYYRF